MLSRWQSRASGWAWRAACRGWANMVLLNASAAAVLVLCDDCGPHRFDEQWRRSPAGSLSYPSEVPHPVHSVPPPQPLFAAAAAMHPPSAASCGRAPFSPAARLAVVAGDKDATPRHFCACRRWGAAVAVVAALLRKHPPPHPPLPSTPPSRPLYPPFLATPPPAACGSGWRAEEVPFKHAVAEATLQARARRSTCLLTSGSRCRSRPRGPSRVRRGGVRDGRGAHDTGRATMGGGRPPRLGGAKVRRCLHLAAHGRRPRRRRRRGRGGGRRRRVAQDCGGERRGATA